MAGVLHNMLPLALVTLVSYLTAELLGGIPIYDQLLDRLLANQKAAQVKRKSINVK